MSSFVYFSICENYSTLSPYQRRFIMALSRKKNSKFRTTQKMRNSATQAVFRIFMCYVFLRVESQIIFYNGPLLQFSINSFHLKLIKFLSFLQSALRSPTITSVSFLCP